MPSSLNNEKLPSGYNSSEYLGSKISVTNEVLPWLDENAKYELHISKLDINGSSSILVASTIGSNKDLVLAASSMSEHQSDVTNNMFYSRLPGFLETGHSSNVDTLDESITDFPIKVMRNKSGQRVYFSRVELGIPEELDFGPTILKLAVCDKSKQLTVMKILSGSSKKEIKYKMRGSK